MSQRDERTEAGALRSLLKRLSMPADDWAQSRESRRPATLLVLMWMLVGVLVVVSLTLWFEGSDAAGVDPRHAVALALIVLALAITLVVIHQVRWFLLEPLSQLYRWALTMCSGDLSARLPERQRGSFAKFSFHINRLSEALDRLVNEMDEVVVGQTARLKEKNASLEMLYELTATINETVPLEEMLMRVARKLMTMLEADSAVVNLRAEDGSQTEVGRLGKSGNSLPSDAPVLVGGAGEVVTIPLMYQGKELGVLSLVMERAREMENAEYEKLLENVGKHLGMAIAKARLDNESRRLSLMRTRTALAHELHDSLAQTLAGLRFQVRMLDDTLSGVKVEGVEREIRRIKGTLDEAHTELRELIAHFRAPVDKRGLVPALRDLVGKLERESSIDIFLQPDFEDPDLPEAYEIQVLRIVHEALVNVVKHSDARNARVLLHTDADNQFQVLIEDDGCGMSGRQELGHPGEHIGLSIMRDRAKRVGGELTIDSEPGEGTRIMLTIPRAESTRPREVSMIGH